MTFQTFLTLIHLFLTVATGRGYGYSIPVVSCVLLDVSSRCAQMSFPAVFSRVEFGFVLRAVQAEQLLNVFNAPVSNRGMKV